MRKNTCGCLLLGSFLPHNYYLDNDKKHPLCKERVITTTSSRGSWDWYLNHLYTIKKWHVKQERIQIAESIMPTAHLMNSSPTRSINIFKTETNQGTVT